MPRPKKEKAPEATQTREIATYEPEAPAKLGHQMFDSAHFRWGTMSVYDFRLLLMIAQQANKEKAELVGFTNWVVDLETVMMYLGIGDNADRRHTMTEILGYVKGFQKLQVVLMEGDILDDDWEVLNLCYGAKYNAKKKSFTFRLTPAAGYFLSQMRRFAMIKPANFMKLDTPYKQILYSYFRDVVNRSRTIHFEVEMEKLKAFLGLEDSYNDKDGKRHFCNRVLGIEMPSKWKYNKTGANSPWQYIKHDKTGKNCGTLYSINTETDLEVSAYAYNKKGIVWLHFAVAEKKRVPQAAIVAPGAKEEPPIEDTFTVWERLVAPGTFDGLELPGNVLLDKDHTHLWWLWHLSMPRSSVEALRAILEKVFAAVPDGESWMTTDDHVRDAINKFKKANNVTPLIPYQEWQAVSLLHTISSETFSLSAVIETCRATDDDGKWQRIIEACKAWPYRTDIKQVTPWLQKCIKNKTK